MMTRRTAMITGASRGIGAEIARRTAAEGFDITAVARQPAGLESMAAELRRTGAQVNCVAANLAIGDEAARIAEAHAATFDRLDLLVLGAGTGANHAVADMPRKAVDLQIAVNLHVPILLVQACLPQLRATAATSKSGTRIVALASITGVAGQALHSVYGAAKAGLVSFCETTSTEESANGVNATAISPGYVDTDMTQHLHDTIDPESMLTTGDVAETVLMLTRLSRRTVIPNVVLSRAGAQVWRA